MHTPEERRRINNDKIKSLGIACFENLPMIESSTDVKIKDIDTIYNDETKLPDYILDGKPYKIESIYGLNRYDGARYIYFSLIQVNRKFHNLSELIFSEKFVLNQASIASAVL